VPATSVTIAAAIVTAIDAGSFTETVRTSRYWTPDIDQSSLQTDTEPVLTVIPSLHTQHPYTRGEWADQVAIDVGFRARCLTTDRADELAALMEQILDHVRDTVDTSATLPLKEARTDPLYDTDTLASYQIWFGVFRFSFGLTRQEAD